MHGLRLQNVAVGIADHMATTAGVYEAETGADVGSQWNKHGGVLVLMRVHLVMLLCICY